MLGKADVSVPELLESGFFAEKAAEKRHHRDVILKGFQTFAEAPGDVLQSLDYQTVLLESSFRELPRLLVSTFEDEKALKRKASRELWSTIFNAGDERRSQRGRDAGRARYTSRPQLLTGHLENHDERVWAAKTRAAMNAWLGWLVAMLPLHKKGGTFAFFRVPARDCC